MKAFFTGTRTLSVANFGFLPRFPGMNAAILFTIALALILLRAFVLHRRATKLDSDDFRALPREVKLAILKERVLETPSERNLQNLGTFLSSEGISADIESYRPLLAEQLRIGREENAIALDGDLYARESEWMDKIEPFEFAEAKKLKEAGDADCVKTYLQGVLRYYSDEKIERALADILPEFPAAQKMLDDYRALTALRDSSGADEASLEKLSRAKETWARRLIGD